MPTTARMSCRSRSPISQAGSPSNYSFGHGYSPSGTYTIAVTVTDDDGGPGYASTSVTTGYYYYLTLENAEAAPAESQPDTTITSEAINAILPQAVAHWRLPGVELQPVDIRIVDLPDRRLAAANPDTGTILIDRDAAGFGWLAGPDDNSPAATGRVDLLSALAHEVGHLLGRHHDDQNHDVMREFLSAGIRSVPHADRREHLLVDRIFADDFFKAARPMDRQQRNSIFTSDLFRDDLLPRFKSESSQRKSLVAPLARRVVEAKLLDEGFSATSDSGGGANDELDLLLGGDAERHMDIDTDELTGSARPK